MRKRKKKKLDKFDKIMITTITIGSLVLFTSLPIVLAKMKSKCDIKNIHVHKYIGTLTKNTNKSINYTIVNY